MGNSVSGDDRGHVLTPNRECDLGHDAVNFDINDSADKLIASADSAELGTSFPYGDLLPWQIQIFIYFTLGNSMVPTLSLDRAYLPVSIQRLRVE